MPENPTGPPAPPTPPASPGWNVRTVEPGPGAGPLPPPFEPLVPAADAGWQVIPQPPVDQAGYGPPSYGQNAYSPAPPPGQHQLSPQGYPAPAVAPLGYPPQAYGQPPFGQAGQAPYPYPAWQPPGALPPGKRPSRFGLSTFLKVRLGIAAIFLILGAGGWAIRQVNASHGGQSTDGAFAAGDCVTLTTTQVGRASCTTTHDGKVVSVIHSTTQSCPNGTVEFDVTDGTGNLCINKAQ